MRNLLFAIVLFILSSFSSLVFAQASNDLISIDNWSASPAENYSTSSTITFSGSRAATASILIDGQLRVDEGDGDWQVSLPERADGFYNFQVTGVDTQGQSTSPINIPMTVDTTPPTIGEFYPYPDTVIGYYLHAFSINANEYGSLIDLDRSYIDIVSDTGETFHCSSTDRNQPCWLTMGEGLELVVAFQSPLTDGSYEIRSMSRIYDRAGHVAILDDPVRYTINTSREISVGEISGLNPTPEINYHNHNNYHFQGTREPDTAVLINGQEVVPDGYRQNWEYQLSDLPEGENRFRFQWVDEYDNRSDEVEYVLFIDTVSPEFGAFTPANNSVLTEPLSQFKVAVNETGSGLDMTKGRFLISPDVGDSFSCYPNDSNNNCWFTLNTAGNEITVNLNTPLTDGAYQIRHQGYTYLIDNAGLRVNLTEPIYYSINISGEVPVGEINALESAPEINYHTATSYTFNGTRYPQTAVLINDQEVVSQGSGDWSYNVSDLPEGENHFRVQWVDAQGNRSDEVEYVLFVDTVSPKFGAFAPANNSALTQPLAQFKVTVNETGSGLDMGRSHFYIVPKNGTGFWCYANNNSDCWFVINAAGDEITVNLNTLLTDGVYEIDEYHTRLMDKVGNSGKLSESVYYHVNTSGEMPVGEINALKSAPEINYHTATSYTFNGTRYPQTAVLINDQEVVPVGAGDWEYRVSDLSEGENHFRVQWVDAQGNRSDEVEYVLFVDTVRPNLTGLNPPDGGEHSPFSEFSILTDEQGSGFSRIDNNSGVSLFKDGEYLFNCRVTNRHDECVLVGGDSVITIRLPGVLDAGQYDLAIGVYDNAGHYVEHQDLGDNRFRFSITGQQDNEPPAKPTLSAYDSTVTQAQITLSGTKEQDSYIVINGQQRSQGYSSESWSFVVPLDAGSNQIDILARDASGNDSESIQAYVNFNDTPPGGVSFTATANADGRSIGLDWHTYDEFANGADIADYLLYASTEPLTELRSDLLLQTVSGGNTTGIITSLTAGETYFVTVVARDQSQQASLTFNVAQVILVDTQSPYDVQGLAASNVGADVLLSWQTPQYNEQDIAWYRILVNDIAVADVPAGNLQYTLSGLPAQSVSVVKVVTIDASDNESTGVAITVATPYANPIGVAVTPNTYSATLSWTGLEPVAGISGYNVYVSTEPFSSISGMMAVTTAPNSAQSIHVGGLSNGQTYYLAVTTENILGYETPAVQTVSVTPQVDVNAPQIDSITVNEQPFNDGQILTVDSLFCLQISDDSALSRVEFYLDGQLDLTRSNAQTAGYCYQLFMESLTDGAHQIEVQAFDIYENTIAQTLSFNTQLAVPAAPIIAKPLTGTQTNQTSMTISGTAPANVEVQVTIEDQSSDWVPVNASGQFFIDTNLVVEGENTITAKARNRAGEGATTSAIIVTLDRSLPSQPIGLVAQTLDAGEVRLEWAISSSQGVTGFDVYRSTQPFEAVTAATKINASLLSQAGFNDVLLDDGIYYYRVVAVNELGTISQPSSIVDVVADSTPPVAERIRYTTDGVYDEASNTYGIGQLSIELIVNETLLTTPFLSISPDGGAPIAVVLTPVTGKPLHYTGSISLEPNMGTGVAFAVFSARDTAGNRGTDVQQGGQINIDTQGPRVVNITTSPKTPVENDPDSPVTLTVLFELDEVVANASTFAPSYQLSGDNRQPTPITDVVKLEDKQWQATIPLPANAGLTTPELMTFRFTAQDSLGNTGSEFNREYSTQIYQGDLPPLATPFNFRGTALPDGKVKLEWVPIEDAIGYQLYRKAPGEADMTEYQRLNLDGHHEDTTSVDGEYEYQLASIRSANGVESISAPSASIVVSTDSVPPESPTNLTLELTPIGIQARWDAVNAPDIRYRLYRDAAGPIISTIDLEPILSDLVEPQVVDTQAVQEQPAYTVVAVDRAGNESAPAETAYLNVELLPVSSMTIRLDMGTNPHLTWTHSSQAIDQFDVYLGGNPLGTKLNATTLTQTSYVDTSYANTERQYAIVAIDTNQQQSLARSLVLPNVSMTLADDQIIKRNVMNRAQVIVENLGLTAIHNARIKFVGTGDEVFQSSPFSVAADASQTVPLVIPGLETLPDQWDISLELHSAPNPGETVQIAQPATLTVMDSALGLRLETEDFIRGSDGVFAFTLNNHAEEAIELLTATHFGNRNSPDVVFTLVDAEDNVLALTPYKQALGEGVVNTTSGDALAKIAAGQSWTSAPVAIAIPDNAPDEVYLVVQINKLYANRGTTEEVRVKGPKLRQLINLQKTPYTGSVDSVEPAVSFGADPIVIKGQALERDTQTALAHTDLKLVIAVSGFEREFEVVTDELGHYTLNYQPQAGESGRYTISALHPVLTSRPQDGEFIINHLNISPADWDLNIPYLYDYDLNVTLTPGDGTELNDLSFAMRATDQPSGEVPTGITLTYPDIPKLSNQRAVSASIIVRAESQAEPSGQFIIAVFSAESPDQPIGFIDVIYQLSEAKPATFHSPSVLELGTTLEGVSTGEIKLENRGLTALENVNLALKTHDGFAADAWLTLLTSASLGNLDVGDEQSVMVQLQPNNAAPVGVQQFYLEVTSSNAEPYFAPIFTAIVESGEGGVLFKVSDMYTGTLDGQGRVIQGLPNAKVRLENEAIPSIRYALVADELGEVLLENIPAGRYSAWITADNYQEEHVRLRIQPGIIHSEQVFLDYNLIRLEWSVSEITIEDKYEIVLSATFETDVPAAVVMLEPTSIALPAMEPGDVLYGELSLTNYGLIRAFDVEFTPKQSDEFFQYDYLTSVIPSSLEAKQVVVIPYKITALKSLEQQDASGGGCGAYAGCSYSKCQSRCPTGISESSGASCVTRSYGRCPATGDSPRQKGDHGGEGGGGDPTGPSAGYVPPGLPGCRGDGMCPDRK